MELSTWSKWNINLIKCAQATSACGDSIFYKVFPFTESHRSATRSACVRYTIRFVFSFVDTVINVIYGGLAGKCSTTEYENPTNISCTPQRLAGKFAYKFQDIGKRFEYGYKEKV